jgi:hypothetical protein
MSREPAMNGVTDICPSTYNDVKERVHIFLPWWETVMARDVKRRWGNGARLGAGLETLAASRVQFEVTKYTREMAAPPRAVSRARRLDSTP